MANGTFGTYVLIDPRKLAEVLRGPNGPVVRMLIRDGEDVKTRAKQECPVYVHPDAYSAAHRERKAGTLRDSIVKRVAQSATGEPAVLVGSADSVALFVHEGTIPHVISARRKPMLVFYWRKVGRVVRFKSVNHPGNQPNRFLIRALAVLKGRY